MFKVKENIKWLNSLAMSNFSKVRWGHDSFSFLHMSFYIFILWFFFKQKYWSVVIFDYCISPALYSISVAFPTHFLQLTEYVIDYYLFPGVTDKFLPLADKCRGKWKRMLCKVSLRFFSVLMKLKLQSECDFFFFFSRLPVSQNSATTNCV